MKHWETLEIFPLPFHKPLIINCFKLVQLAIKTMQSHYCPWCTCQLDIFFSALWWLILTPGHDENCKEVTQNVHISNPNNFDPYIYNNSFEDYAKTFFWVNSNKLRMIWIRNFLFMPLFQVPGEIMCVYGFCFFNNTILKFLLTFYYYFDSLVMLHSTSSKYNLQFAIYNFVLSPITFISLEQ